MFNECGFTEEYRPHSVSKFILVSFPDEQENFSSDFLVVNIVLPPGCMGSSCVVGLPLEYGFANRKVFV